MFRKRPRVWAVGSSSSGELSSRVAMKKSWRRINRQQKLDEQLYKQALLPLYGLPPEWQGGRFLGRRSSSRNKHRVRAHALSLVHRSVVEGEDPSLSVETAEPDLGAFGGGALLCFAEGIWFAEADPITRVLEPPPMGEEPLIPLPLRTRSIVHIDQEPVEFDLLTQPTDWIGRASFRGHVITIEGRNFPYEGLALVPVPDVKPYVEGTRRLLKSWERNSRQ